MMSKSRCLALRTRLPAVCVEVDSMSRGFIELNRCELSRRTFIEIFDPVMCGSDENKIECYSNEWDVLSLDSTINNHSFDQPKTYESANDLDGKIIICEPGHKMCQRNGHVYEPRLRDTACNKTELSGNPR